MIAFALGLWQAVKLFGIWDKIGAGLRWVAQSSTRLLAAAVVVLLLIALWQHHEAAKQALYARQTKAAWDAARRDAAAAQAQAEARYRSLAHDADQKYSDALAEGGTRLAAYVAAHRLRPAPQTYRASPAQGGNPAVPENAPASPVMAQIAVSESDLKACDADYSYAKAAHDWAARFNAQP